MERDVEREGLIDGADVPQPAGIEGVYLANRPALLRFLRARGAGDAAEDLLQEIWLRITASRPGPVPAPLAYLYRVANNVMIDRHRSLSQAARRDADWSETHAEQAQPSPENDIAARQEAAQLLHLVDGLGPRVAAALRRHRIDGLSQREVAAELGVSISTIESDLRTAYRVLLAWKERRDEA
ncbi:RNA polymerase sigma factor [Croceicoccus marinus]|uniref:RNA polymerase sigma factor n=1 Tax=Croceicoccus marinus TaxID=450378 RepID=A0A7G6VVA0_9SPHN|nr:RNA polymerase sigma factor [Croceicoccus marinus]QNE05665.1 RNA polymerase sigma factor [Croceicoccus marinus]